MAAHAVDAKPAGKLIALKTPRIALVDVYGGSMPSGWNRWLMEQFEFPYTVVYPQDLDAGKLKARFDVVLMPDDLGIEAHGRETPRRGPGQPQAAEIPEQYRGFLGRITAEKTGAQLEAFMKAGGTVLAVGNSTGVAEMMKLPVTDPMVETVGGEVKPLPNTKFYIPGSVVEVKVDQTTPLSFGVGPTVPVFFDSSPVFKATPGATGLKTVAAFAGPTPLMSGWALGQELLEGASAILQSCVGNGQLVLYGPEVNQRAQSHAAFKFLFNGLYAGATRSCS